MLYTSSFWTTTETVFVIAVDRHSQGRPVRA